MNVQETTNTPTALSAPCSASAGLTMTIGGAREVEVAATPGDAGLSTSAVDDFSAVGL